MFFSGHDLPGLKPQFIDDFARGLPTLRESLPAYASAKQIKSSSLKRYQSILRTHFSTWLDLNDPAFSEHCREFAQTNGAAVVEVGRGLIGALIKYLNAVHSLSICSPFAKLADAGLMPERAQPRARRLQEADMPSWRSAIDKLPERHRDYPIHVQWLWPTSRRLAGA